MPAAAPTWVMSSSPETMLLCESIDRVTEGSSVSWPSRSTGSPMSRSLSDEVPIDHHGTEKTAIWRYNARMDETTFDYAAREELHAIEDAFADVDPDECEVSTSDGVLRLDLRD